MAKVEVTKVTNTNSFPLFSSQARAICDREVSSRFAYLYCKLQTRKSINQVFCFLISYWTRLSRNPLKVFPFCFRISMAWKLRRPWNSFSPAALRHVSTSNFKDLCLRKHCFKFLSFWQKNNVQFHTCQKFIYTKPIKTKYSRFPNRENGETSLNFMIPFCFPRRSLQTHGYGSRCWVYDCQNGQIQLGEGFMLALSLQKDSERPSYSRTTCFLNLFDRQQRGKSMATAVARRWLQRNMWTNAFKETKHAGSTIEARDEKQELSFPPTLVVLPPSHSPGTTQPPGAKGWNPMAPGAPCCFNMKLPQNSPMLKTNDSNDRT